MSNILNVSSSVRITREARKGINPTLHAHGLPTLGASRTLTEYRATLTRAQRAVLAGPVCAPVTAPTHTVESDILCGRAVVVDVLRVSEDLREEAYAFFADLVPALAS